jgi:hypothetical protein
VPVLAFPACRLVFGFTRPSFSSWWS